MWTSKDGIVWNNETDFSKSPYSPRLNLKIMIVQDILLYLVSGINDKLEVIINVCKIKDGLYLELIISNPEFRT